MNNLENACQCICGAEDFQVRFQRDEQVGLLTCAAGHHSLLLDSRDYWTDVVQDGRPKSSRCRCGSRLFRVKLEYEFRQDGDVRRIRIKPICATCGRDQRPTEIDIKYGPTDQLIAKPLDPIEQPSLQPKRHEITALWKPADAERFAIYLAESLGARVFAEKIPYKFTEVPLAEVEFRPELRHDLLFTTLDEVTAPQERHPENSHPFLRLNGPLHMLYSGENVSLLHYIRYSREVVREGTFAVQPALFLKFARAARDWLNQSYVSLRGKNTADNLEECHRANLDRTRGR